MEFLTEFTNFKSLLQSYSEAVLVLDRDGYIRYFNPCVSRLTGYESSDLLNKSLVFFYNNPDDNIKVEYELSLARKHGRHLSEGWRPKKDGARFWGEMTITPFNE